MSIKPKLQFDPATHTYTLGGHVLPSVTQVLGILQSDYSGVPREVVEAAGRRGTAVHALLENDEDISLIVESTKKQHIAPHPSGWKAATRQKLEQRTGQNLDGYVDAARRFVCDSGFSTTVSEQLAYHPVYKYAGRLDRAGTLRINGNLAIVDWKTGIITPTVRLQLAAYANLLKDPRKYRRLAVKLNCNGTYKVHEYPSSETARDFQVFLAALACYRWRKQYN